MRSAFLSDDTRLLRYPSCERCREAGGYCARCEERIAGRRSFLADALRARCEERDYSALSGEAVRWSNSSDFSQGWVHRNAPEPAIQQLADGISESLGAIKAFGNAVVPQIPELIGRAILQSMEEAA